MRARMSTRCVMIAMGQFLAPLLAHPTVIAIVLLFLTPNMVGAEARFAHEGPSTSNVVYVDVDVSGGAGDGSSWGNAFESLQEGVDAADAGMQVWVVAGTYTPQSWPNGGFSDARMKHFSLKNGVEVYGGFAGTEIALSQRDWTSNPTILSGDIGVEADPSDNCYHLFFHPRELELDATAVLDGFTLMAANADGTETTGKGGGMYNFLSSPTVLNCVFRENFADEGGGMFNDTASPTIVDCTFTANSADDGGGMFNDFFSAPMLTDCEFAGNAADWNGGGMLNDYISAPMLTGCTFSGNSADWNGGGMFNYNASIPTIERCTLTNNSAWQGGGMYNYFSSPVVVDTVVADNTAQAAGNQVFNMYGKPRVID